MFDVRLNRLALVLLLAAVLCPRALHAGKITQDPNAPGARQEQAQVEVDARLSQKITYTSTDKRLHSVIADLSKQSEVVVRCGTSKRDWQVRDIPIVVCAEDIELGRLLRAIADSTHLLFTSTTVDGEEQYRIWRDKSREEDVQRYFDAVDAARRARGLWTWQAWTEYGKVPDEIIAAQPPDVRPPDKNAERPFSKLMASLPADALERAAAGEKTVLSVSESSPQVAALLRQIYSESWAHRRAEASKYVHALPPSVRSRYEVDATDENMADVELEIEITKGGSFRTLLKGGPGGGLEAFMSTAPTWVGRYVPSLPEFPAEPDPPEYDLMRGIEMVDLNDEPAFPPGTDKMEVKAPDRDAADQTFADAVAALSDASGLTIVCEDFRSHKRYCYGVLYDRPISLHNAFQNLGYDLNWFGNSDDKMMVGFGKSWCRDHTNLVPEQFVVGLERKLDTTGADFDDVVSLVRLTDGQYADWIYESRELSIIAWRPAEQHRPLWELYDSLSETDKALAKSEDGLPLSKLDPAYLSYVFEWLGSALDATEMRAQVLMVLQKQPDLRRRVGSMIRAEFPEAGHEPGTVDLDAVHNRVLEAFPELRDMSIVPTDPLEISQLVLKVEKTEVTALVRIDNADGLGYRVEKMPQLAREARYALRLTGPSTDFITRAIPLRLPAYSIAGEKKRTDELLKAR